MKTASRQRPLRVGLISLGCAKNLVDGEIMLGALARAGLEITSDADGADAVIVNTCSFIDAAQAESVDAILQSAALRDAHRRGQALVVAGCLPQRFRQELPRLLPEVDAFMGIDQVTRVADIVREALRRRAARPGKARSTDHRAGHASLRQSRQPADGSKPPLVDVAARPTFIPDFATPRFRLTPRHFAYLKIAEGCNHPCSFCVIPRIRGRHRSRPQADVVREARQLLAEGVKELNLISQDTTYYGLDLLPRRVGASAAEKFQATLRARPADASTLNSLLRELDALPGDFWIRLLYTHPAHWTDELIETIADCPKVTRYVDIPLQHIHPLLLERMRRETSREHILDLLGRLRERIPGIALRTTFIVGFPGETEACFEALLAFIRATRFERLGVFTYSQEAGTRAAQMDAQVPEKVKQRRRELAMAAQRQVARELCAAAVGRTLKVLVERPAHPGALPQSSILSPEHGLTRDAGTPGLKLEIRNPKPGTDTWRVARSEADAPDIDGRVYVRGRLPAGDFARVRIVGHADYDLIAEPA
jgi:ribosomal protein S12 methylthiotransferase